MKQKGIDQICSYKLNTVDSKPNLYLLIFEYTYNDDKYTLQCHCFSIKTHNFESYQSRIEYLKQPDKKEETVSNDGSNIKETGLKDQEGKIFNEQ